MTIEENLALAYLRASHPYFAVFPHYHGRTRELFTDRLVQLGLGLENRMKQPVGLLSGGQRQALTLLMRHPGYPQIAVAGRAHCGPGPRHRR